MAEIDRTHRCAAGWLVAMRLVLAFCFLVLLRNVALSQTVKLDEESNASLSVLLSKMEIIAERGNPIDSTFPYFLRIIRMRSDGECSPGFRDCPTAFVYISISSSDEAPDRKLYRLPDAYGWELYRWSYIPREESPKEFVVFLMEKQILLGDPPNRRWSKEIYEIKVNLVSGTMRRIP